MEKRKQWGHCALCGERREITREHVVPRSLYPPSKSNSVSERITIPACSSCNNGTSDDDAHFKNVLLMAGEPNSAAKEIWQGSARRGFARPDGHRRARDLFDIMELAPEAGKDRYRIYPARDPRILKTVRKIVRGLAYYHNVALAVKDEQVTADVRREPVPLEMLDLLEHRSAEADIFQYSYIDAKGIDGFSSFWFLTFFERTQFIAAIRINESL